MNDTKAKSTTVFTNAKAWGIQDHFNNSPFSAVALVYANNPSGFITALRNLNLTTIITPDSTKIDPIIRRLLFRKDFTDIKAIMTAVTYDPTATNWTVNPNLWAAMQLSPGDFLGLYNKYVASAN